MSLALCLIMKNESKFLEPFFSNSFADNIYVLDTGSDDDSVAIAQKYTKNIFKKEFNNNFSSLRNYLIGLVKEDWILFLDADEILLQAEWKKLRRLIDEDPEVGGYRFLRYNFFATGGWYSDMMVKVFKNNEGFKYQKKATERIEPSIIKKGFKVADAPITLNHFGYVRSFEDRNKKNNQYISIMQDQILANPEDTLAKSALAIIQRNSGDLPNATANALEGAAANPNSELAQLFLGYVYESSNKLDLAIKQYRKVLEINSGNYRALNALGVVYLSKGEYAAAREYFEHAIAVFPIGTHLNINLGLTYFFEGNYRKAIYLFKKVLAENPYFGLLDQKGILEIDNQKQFYYETINNYWGLKTYLAVCKEAIGNDEEFFFHL
ncbi:tetratricopeptide repeat protein [Xylocopilactobacillus apicola]|uniref:Glycosyltransferase 2-like domain-containing protein n=1 Tax=Xylocopilactobacillus apicola TaxID=2932184 RepID=A0AAU9CZG0_9LACO|nr:tetratricopeptide repeat protein [Xylocopilactobacillus apicola]BDR57816.1 hypothetical protein XA3_02570 [Xylocopilactobacillus apicola]